MMPKKAPEIDPMILMLSDPVQLLAAIPEKIRYVPGVLCGFCSQRGEHSYCPRQPKIEEGSKLTVFMLSKGNCRDYDLDLSNLRFAKDRFERIKALA